MDALLNLLEPDLTAVLDRELAAGNSIAQVDRNWPQSGKICVLLKDYFRARHVVDQASVRKIRDDDPHGPIEMYVHVGSGNCIFCSTFRA